MVTPLPTLIKDQEQVKLERIRQALKCFASYLWITKDAKSHIFPSLQCPNCNDMSFCRKVRKIIEDCFNTRKGLLAKPHIKEDKNGTGKGENYNRAMPILFILAYRARLCSSRDC